MQNTAYLNNLTNINSPSLCDLFTNRKERGQGGEATYGNVLFVQLCNNYYLQPMHLNPQPMRLLFLLSCIVFASCNSSPVEQKPVSTPIAEPSKVEQFKQIDTKGEQTFTAYCSRCHIVPDQGSEDPAIFLGLFDHLPPPAEQYFERFIMDSKALKASGDKYANSVDDAYNSDYEHQFADTLTQKDVQNLIVFIKSTYM